MGEVIALGDERGARARTCSIAVSSNAAMCKLKLGQHEACVNMCDEILRLDAANAKAMYRKGLALRALGEVAEAEAVLRLAAELEPKDATIQRELVEIAQKQRRDKDREKRLAQKML